MLSVASSTYLSSINREVKDQPRRFQIQGNLHPKGTARFVYCRITTSARKEPQEEHSLTCLVPNGICFVLEKQFEGCVSSVKKIYRPNFNS